METVSFRRMADGTKADYDLLARYEAEYAAGLADRLLRALDGLKQTLAGYQVTRYEHSLQSATRAFRDGRSDEYVVAALLHDVGDELAPYTHGEMVGAILKPYVSEEICWVVAHHGIFQAYYYAHHYGDDRHARDRFRDHPHYAACAEFCERYDQNCFDPDYESLPVEFFEPMVRRVFAGPRFLTG
ncbi:MAG TPA: hypothetical protein VE777_18720 [Gaiellales bacterium]|nr:hypothetical protein [Gaiellales bacterium]